MPHWLEGRGGDRKLKTENRELPLHTLTDHSYLSHVKRPARYTGREINAIYKDPRAVALRAVLVFPDLYEVGMSHLGLALLYDLLNRPEWLWAERTYAPAPDLEAELRRWGQPLSSLESGASLRTFDLVGVSLQYELGYTNLLTILDLGGIPLLAEQRGPHDPVVVGGGPLAFNPEPVAPFFDALVLGDGEEAALEVAAVVRDWKAARGTRQELWHALEELEGVYVPAFFEPTFDKTGGLQEILPRGRRSVIRKRILPDLDGVALSPRPLVPYCRVIHDRLNLEITRGCSRGCRYCQAGMIYRPVREREPHRLLDWVEDALEATGYEEISLLSLSTGDYQALAWLLTRLMDHLEPQRIALSLPSLRADTLTPEMVSQIQRVRRTGLTIAPEAGSDRLREIVNKNLPEEVIIASARRAFRHGWRLLKLYFMIGLPQETSADLEAIASLARQVLKSETGGAPPQLHLSLSTFIPKPHTPFQWEGQAGLEDSRRRLHEVKDLLRHRQIKIKWNSVAQSWLEGIFSRGDRRLAQVLLAAYRRGCRLDAWSEHLRLEPWRQAFREAGVDPEAYLRQRDQEEVLPWDHLDSGVNRGFLAEERQRAYQARQTPDCRTDGCQGCGICDESTVVPRLQTADLALEGHPSLLPSNPLRATPPRQKAPPIRYRLSYAKLAEARWLSHLELVSALYRSLRRSGLPLAFSAGFHPLPQLSFHGALPVGVESLAETMDLDLSEPVEASQLAASLNLVLPPGLKILQAKLLLPQMPPPAVTRIAYQVKSPEPVFGMDQAARFLAQEKHLVTRKRPREERAIDICRLVADLQVADPCHLKLDLNVLEKGNLKVTEVIAAIFGLTEREAENLKILKLISYYREGPIKASPLPGDCVKT